MLRLPQIENSLPVNGGEGLMAYTVKYKEADALALYKRIVMIVSKGDSAEIKARPDGTLTLFKVRKEREEVPT